ncbi:MAG: hypothetical protein ABJ275_12405 [Maricaulaceae bacterium]
MLKRALIIVGFLLPIFAIIDMIIQFKHHAVSLYMADVVSMLRFLALGLLCLFAASKIDPMNIKTTRGVEGA